jgi:hypothetical protein
MSGGIRSDIAELMSGVTENAVFLQVPKWEKAEGWRLIWLLRRPGLERPSSLSKNDSSLSLSLITLAPSIAAEGSLGSFRDRHPGHETSAHTVG